MLTAFNPSDTNSIAATATAQSRALPAGGSVAHIYNEGTNTVFVAFGIDTVVATLPAVSAAAGTAGNSTPIPAGQSLSFSVRPGFTHWSAICKATQTAEAYCTMGAGN